MATEGLRTPTTSHSSSLFRWMESRSLFEVLEQPNNRRQETQGRFEAIHERNNMPLVPASAGSFTKWSRRLLLRLLSAQVNLQLTEMRPICPTTEAFYKPLAWLHDARRKPPGHTFPSASLGAFFWTATTEWWHQWHCFQPVKLLPGCISLSAYSLFTHLHISFL